MVRKGSVDTRPSDVTEMFRNALSKGIARLANIKQATRNTKECVNATTRVATETMHDGKTPVTNLHRKLVNSVWAKRTTEATTFGEARRPENGTTGVP